MAEANRQVIEDIYREAVALADRARAWFEGPGAKWRANLPVDAQAAVATESLGVTSRLMAVMSWLLDPAHAIDGAPMRAFVVEAGEMAPVAPLAGTRGGEIVVASRQLAARIAAITGDPA